MQDVVHETLEEWFEDIGFVHSGVAIGTRDAAPDVQERLNHACLGEGDCIFNSWLGVAAIFDCVGGGDGQEEGEENLQSEKFHCRPWSRSKSVGFEREEKSRLDILVSESHSGSAGTI